MLGLKGLAVIISISCLGAVAQQSSLVCPTFSLVNVSSDNRDNLVFGAFPPDTDPPDNDYNPGAIGPWYDIGSGIINVVQPGSVTEDVIVPLIKNTNANLSNINNLGNIFGDETPQDIGRDVATWMAGIIALTVLGGLLAISMLVCCCCFGLCRCCGKCGGGLKQEETSKTNCLTIVFTVILIVFVCWLIAGVILAFFSNQQVFNSVTEFEDTIEDTFVLAETFINDTVLKIDTLLCEVEDTFDVTVIQADALIVQANGVVDNFSGVVYNIVDQTLNVSQEIENTLSTLMSINTSVNSLQGSTASINSSLQTIAMELDSAFSNCSALPMLLDIDCSALDSNIYSNGLGANFFEVPNIAGELSNVQDVVGGINLTETALQGNETFNSEIQQITNITTDIDQIISDGLKELQNVTVSANDLIKDFSDSVIGPDGYIQRGRDVSSQAFDFIRQYDTPRYAVGVVISCSAISVIVLVLLGVTCGLCGFRTDRAPYERTDLSNCGGITLICAAFVAFLIGFFVLFLSAFMFFFGGVSTKICYDLAPPDYILFAQTIDNLEVTGGEYLLSNSLFNNGSIALTVSGILISCSGNATVYQALKLENLDFIREIQNFTNISQLIPDVSLNVTDLSNSINSVFDSDSFVPADLQMRLDEFTTTGVNAINISRFRQQLDQDILLFNVTAQIMQLEGLRTQLQGINTTQQNMHQINNIVASIDNSIAELMTIDTTVNGLGTLVDTLDGSVQQLDINGQSLTNAASALLTNINTTFQNLIDDGVTPLVNNASEVFPRAIGYAQQLVDYGLNALQNEVGNCRPIAAVYSGFYNSYCSFTVDALNGFWLALGMCGVLMIPIIIFAVITSHYYRRMKYEDDVGIPYESSFPMKTY